MAHLVGAVGQPVAAWTAFYERDGDAFVPSELTRGPWDPGAQHAGPPTALLGRALEADGLIVARITVEILRPVPIAPLTVATRVVRPGRNVELVESALPRGRRRAARARPRDRLAAPRRRPASRRRPTSRRRPARGGGGKPFFPTGQATGYHTAMDVRFVTGGFVEPGPAVVWLRMRQPLVDDEPPSPLVRALVAADTGNGVSAELDFHRYVFINTELTVHLTREPEGEWVCLDAVTRTGPEGVGLSESVLADKRGRFGRADQTLFVRRR